MIGVSTLVGETLVNILAEQDFPLDTLYPLDGADEAGGRVEFKGRHLRVGDVASFDFSQVQLAFFCADADISAAYVPRATAAGCVVIDDSGLFRMEADVPLVVAEVNPESLAGWRARRIIANPNAATVLMLTALKPIHDAVGITRINVATYQAVSGVGRAGLEELGRQTADLLNMRSLETPVFSRQIAFNLLPDIGPVEANGYTREEMKMVRETRKILGEDNLQVNPTAVRVPVFYGHAMALHIETRAKLSAAGARTMLQHARGVTVPEDDPTPVTDASGEDAVFVGRIREDISYKNGLDMWLVGDNMRKGGALNCVQIAQVLVKDYM